MKMSSRRLRIKPVANVPVRRGKVNSENIRTGGAGENEEKEDLTKSKEEGTDTPSVEGNSLDINFSPCDGSEQNDIPHSVASSSESVDLDLKDANEISAAGLFSADKTIKSQGSVSDVEAEVAASDSTTSKNESLISGTTLVTDKRIPPGLVRKRMKPPVSIPAITRRPRELTKVLNDDKPECISSLVNGNKNIQEECAQQSTIRNENVSERSNVILSCSPKVDNDVPFAGGTGIGVGVPGITQIIHTGTAIRPQHDNSVNIPMQLDRKAEAPQSLPEPDLPAEGAGEGCSSLLLKSSSSQVNAFQRSRFVKPCPRILDPSICKLKFMGSSVNNNNESDDSRKTHSSDSFPLHNNFRKGMPEYGRPRLALQTPNVTDGIESHKQGSGASTSESEDESRRCLSDASTISPPVRKAIETSRGRFVRPAPRFIEASVRRNSIQSSASESEEELRKGTSTVTPCHKRQTDVTSEGPAVTSSDFGCFEEADKKVTRTRRAPSSCTQRMARARQEFQNKFGNQTPDRSRLTMFDLIFYNPSTNPMKCVERVSGTSKMSESQDIAEHIIEERLAEEQVDEPTADGGDKQNDENAAEEEEDMAMPVPQVKVGPDGQIILDEKSLVIETTGAKKSREDLANSAVIVDYGTGSTGYGTYSKKSKKSKEWSKQETLKFYRALNTVGTDFLLMQSIFPKRTRQDLKTKFKKEDRTNRFLVEKALRYPLDFDLTELEKDLEKEEEEERQKKLAKLLQKQQPRKIRKQKKSANKAKGTVIRKSLPFASMDSGDTGDLPEKKRGGKRRNDGLNEYVKARVKQPCKVSRVLGRGESCSSSSDENELGYNYDDELKFVTENDPVGKSTKPDHNSEASDNDAGELEYLSRPPKPTRSGRIPQPRKLDQMEDDITLGNKGRRDSNILISAKNSSKPGSEFQPPLPLEDLTNVEPGSLVVLATQSPTNPGHHVYKVFMVAPNPGGLPSAAATVSPVAVPLPSTLLQSETGNIPNSQLSDESPPADE